VTLLHDAGIADQDSAYLPAIVADKFVVNVGAEMLAACEAFVFVREPRLMLVEQINDIGF
jgi:hypothetical protein